MNHADREDDYIQYFENIYVFHNDEILIDVIYSIAAGCLWLRVILSLKLTRFMGPLIKMIQLMIKDIMIFLVLFVCDLLVFATIGNLLFVSVHQYETLEEALKTLFASALGGFDMTTLDGNNKGNLTGEIYMIIFLLFNVVLILNLLIAILASTYAILEAKKLVIYINEILKLRPMMEYNSNCSSLVASFAPLNIISLLFSPFFFIKKKTKVLNNVNFCTEYIPVMLVISVFYILVNILLLPFVWLKSVFIKLQMLF